MNKTDDILDKNERLKNFLPVTAFIVLTFLLEAFGLNKATNLVISVFISIFMFGIMTAMVREKYGNLPELNSLQKKLAIMSVLFLGILAVAFLHWYKLFHVNIRWGLFFICLLVYFIFLFRSVNTLNNIKTKYLKRKK
jgi:hypothetical protein